MNAEMDYINRNKFNAVGDVKMRVLIISFLSSRFNGAWSSEGCTLVEDSTETSTCDCNHLTNFAVLMEVGETEVHSS